MATLQYETELKNQVELGSLTFLPMVCFLVGQSEYTHKYVAFLNFISSSLNTYAYSLSNSRRENHVEGKMGVPFVEYHIECFNEQSFTEELIHFVVVAFIARHISSACSLMCSLEQKLSMLINC